MRAHARGVRHDGVMIAITVKWDVKPEYADKFMDLVDEFTRACRAEPGCLWFEWSRSVDDPNQYILLEAYKDGAAGKVHVESDHFKKAMATQGQYAATRPSVISLETDQDGWAPLAEINMPGQ
ncbi:Antibiotic biosynthesis monooxygenase [Propionibacterium freudenreichii]|nr:Antibiotic biosynthesis monooxygenase [Propionibacterium freudenreichii]SCQ80951.1 Antibiotic biosynthesis monooxygenase [Propionibacterium freudenreichii]